MKKLVLLSFLLATLPQWIMGQNIGDDLYFVPKKEKKEKVTKVVKPVVKETMTVITTDGEILHIPADEVVATVSNGKLKTVAVNKTPEVVYDASGVERNVDEYNRRYSSNTEDIYVVETDDDESEWKSGLDDSQEDYVYTTRLIRFRSPRVAVPVSSPLYWDVVYLWSPLDWNVYVGGYYSYVSPTWINFYDPWYYDPWHYDSWHWNYGWSWHSSWGWHDPWYHHHHYPYWGYYPPHRPHHGPIWAGGGGHIGGGWRDGFYYDNRRRAADRPSNSIRATRGNDRGTVASRGNSTSRADRTSGRVSASRDAEASVRPITNGRENNNGAVSTGTRTSRNTVNRNNTSSTRSEGTSTRTNVRSSNEKNTTGTSVRNNSSSRNSSSSSTSRSNSSSRSTSSSNMSNSNNSSSRSSSSYSTRSSSSDFGSFSSGGGSSRSSSSSGGSVRSSGGGSSRSSSGGRR